MLENKYKYLIAIDLDGTLLPHNKIITETSKNYLKYLESKGFLIVIASGRGYTNCLEYYNFIGLKNSPIIAHNGHYIRHPNDKNFPITKFELPFELVKDLADLMDPYVTNKYVENLDSVFLEQNDPKLEKFYHYQNKKMVFGPLEETLNSGALSLVFGLPEIDYKKEEITKKIAAKYPDVEIRFWCDEKYCEIYKSSISKATCIEVIAKYYGIERENIYAFGDTDNDLEIVTSYPHSYLMVNGSQKMFPVARNITEFSNEEDGVIKELQKIFIDI